MRLWFAGGEQFTYVANVPNLDDGLADHAGPTETGCRLDGGEDYARHVDVPSSEAAYGRVRLPESDNHVESRLVLRRTTPCTLRAQLTLVRR